MEVMVLARLSFPDLRKVGRPPKDKPNEPGKYGCHGIIERGSDAHKIVQNAVITVAKEKWGANYATILKSLDAGKKCLRDGDKNLDQKGNVRPEYAGKMFVKASNKNPVPLIAPIAKKAMKQPDGTTVMVWNELPESSGKPYGGCNVKLKIDVYASTAHGNAVHATLQAVQFVSDNTAFSGAPATADGFEDIDGAIDDSAMSDDSMGFDGFEDGTSTAAATSDDDLGLG